jgi:hypothetical protein
MTATLAQTTRTLSATSDGSLAGVDQRKGGLCLDKHMKIKFEVQPGKSRHHFTFESMPQP